MKEATIGPYQLQAEIGWGTMATVYRAVSDGRDDPLAVKVFSARFAHQEKYSQQVQQQVTAVNQLNHPHILPVYDIGIHRDTLYLVTPFMAGGTLRDRLTRDPLPQAQLWPAFTQLAAALDAAHAINIIHRDIKPSNILFDAAGSAFVADFGLMQFLDTTIHASGMPGTLAYMAPEQFAGTAADGRADQYSLAIVVFETLTGRPPFQGNVAQIMYKQVHDPPPLAWLPDEALAPILARALAKKPEDRYESVTAFAQALQQAALAGQPPDAAILRKAPPPPLADRPPTIHPAPEPADADATMIIRPPQQPAAPSTPEPAPESPVTAPPAPEEPPVAERPHMAEPDTPPGMTTAVPLSAIPAADDATFVVERPTLPDPKPDEPSPKETKATPLAKTSSEPDATFIVEPPPADWGQSRQAHPPADPDATFVVELPDDAPPELLSAARRRPDVAPAPADTEWPPPSYTATGPAVRPGAGGKITPAAKRSFKAWPVAVIIIGVILLGALGVAWQRGLLAGTAAAANTPTPTPMLSDLAIAVINPSRKTTWQLGERGGPLAEDGVLPWPTGSDPLRILTSGDPLALTLPGGAQLHLDTNTEVALSVPDAATPAQFLLEIHQGRLVALASSQPVTIKTPLDSTAQLQGGLMGVGYAETPFLFDVDCFSGTCHVTDLDTTVQLAADERSYLEGGNLAAPEPARHELYGFTTAVTPPTATPTRLPVDTATATLQPTSTATATAKATRTPLPTATPTITPTATIVFVARAAPKLVQFTCSAPGTFNKSQIIPFAWTWNDQLRTNEYLEVRVGPKGSSSAFMRSVGSNAEQRGDQWIMNVPAGQFFDFNFFDYEWEVVLVRSVNNTPSVLARSTRGCIHVDP